MGQLSFPRKSAALIAAVCLVVAACGCTQKTGQTKDEASSRAAVQKTENPAAAAQSDVGAAGPVGAGRIDAESAGAEPTQQMMQKDELRKNLAEVDSLLSELKSLGDSLEGLDENVDL